MIEQLFSVSEPFGEALHQSAAVKEHRLPGYAPRATCIHIFYNRSCARGDVILVEITVADSARAIFGAAMLLKRS